jgi:transcriptional regulator with XRE-family HTH domain
MAERKSNFSFEYEVFLSKLIEARKSADFTQQDLAKRVGQTQSWVSKVERGERRLDVIELRAICRALSISFAAFVKQLEAALSAPESRGSRSSSDPLD